VWLFAVAAYMYLSSVWFKKRYIFFSIIKKYINKNISKKNRRRSEEFFIIIIILVTKPLI